MAGYSGTPLPKKLGIKPHARFGVVRAPAGFAESLAELPRGVLVLDGARGEGPFDVIVWFARAARELAQDIPTMKAKLDPAGGLWIAWPKQNARRKDGSISTDLTEAEVRERGLAAGLVDNKVCAIDDTWSGLRFVYRRGDRPKRGR